MAYTVTGVAALLGACLAGGVAQAQGLSDPTRPPYGAYGSETTAAALPGGPVLQSVLITSDRKAAIISGVMVRLGDKYGTARVVQITESEVVLQEGGDSQVLKLYPGVEKRRPGIAEGQAGRGATR